MRFAPLRHRCLRLLCIVMLVASGPILAGSLLEPPASDRCACRPGRSFSALRRSGPAWLLPAVPVGDGSRQAVVGCRGTVPVRLAVPTVSLRSVSSASPSGSLPSVGFPAVPFRSVLDPAEAELSVGPFRAAAIRPTVARLSRHLRFARLFERKNEACFPTLLRASLPSLPVRKFLSLSGGYS